MSDPGDTNPTLDRARAITKARFDAALSEITRFIGTCLMDGKTDREIVDQLNMLRDQIKRDAAVESTRAELNPFSWVIDEAIRKITENRLNKPG